MNYVKATLKTLLQILLLNYCTAIDTITVNKPIKDGDNLVSEKGTFVLGFFSPVKSSNRYVGIWYKVSDEMVLWVANRDSPVNDTSGVLYVNPKGNLVLYGKGQQVPVWSTNVSVSLTNNTIAQLLDSGNLVLIQQDNKRVVWQSFDNPTHVLVSGMKLGFDLRSGLNRYLTSWKSQDDPGTGNCTLEINPNGSPQLMLYKNKAKWWRSGHWNGIQWGGIPALGRSYLVFNITFKNNQNEISVNWTVLDPTIFSFITVDGSGAIQQYSWQHQQHKWVGIYSAPGDPCDDYGKCGAFGNCDPFTLSGFECSCFSGYEPKSPHEWALRDASNGCKRKEGPSMCRNGEGFVKVSNVKVPDTSIVRLESSLTLEECREECLMNCSCLAYANADIRDGGSGCMTWYGNLMDTKQFTDGGQDLFIRVDSIRLEEYAKKSEGISTKRIWAIVGLSIAVTFLLIVSLLYWLRKRKRKGIGGQSSFLNYYATSSTGYEDSSDKSGIDKTTDKTDVQFFDLSIVVKATDNFSSDNKLGQGGFGSVYKGTLDDGQEIAVKRLSVNSGQGEEEFKNEVMLIAKLQHRNLVRLLGCCVHKKEKMLIYECVPNRSLDLFIFDKDRKTMLDWRKRLQIIFGIARGILYLHQDSRLKIIHRDLKASNVLLDATMNPKISDFGMARMFGDDQLEANTNRVVGTYGYMSPEYAMEGLYSIKSDVFSFGVLALEIISGKKNSTGKESSIVNMIGQLWELWREGKALDMVDSSIDQSSYPRHEVLRCMQIGLLCVQEVAIDRPTMLDVVFMLRNETPLPSPSRPAFVYKTSNTGVDSSTSKGVSINEMTVTIVEPR